MKASGKGIMILVFLSSKSVLCYWI